MGLSGPEQPTCALGKCKSLMSHLVRPEAGEEAGEPSLGGRQGAGAGQVRSCFLWFHLSSTLSGQGSASWSLGLPCPGLLVTLPSPRGCSSALTEAQRDGPACRQGAG